MDRETTSSRTDTASGSGEVTAGGPQAPTGLVRVLVIAAAVFDALERRWDVLIHRRALGISLASAFLLTLAAIELGRRGLLPPAMVDVLGTSHFGAVAVAFGALLVVEILQLVFALARSIAESMGKQVELLSLILMRKVFLAVGSFGEPVKWENVQAELYPILADLGGALGIFVLLAFYYRVQRHRPISSDEYERRSFIAAKKAIAVLLLGAFAVLGATALVALVTGGEPVRVFEVFYTILIFSDVLLVLLALAVSSSYPVVFRDTGFAAATICIRLALTAPPYANAALGVGAAAFILALTLAYNQFVDVPDRRASGIAVPSGALDT